MKELFTRTYRGYQFEFRRVLSSSFDPWYHISVNLGESDIKYRMHNRNKEGSWKITVERLPPLLYSLEAEFNELFLLNEKPEDPYHRGMHYRKE